jgi:hypothetical protein
VSARSMSPASLAVCMSAFFISAGVGAPGCRHLVQTPNPDPLSGMPPVPQTKPLLGLATRNRAVLGES